MSSGLAAFLQNELMNLSNEAKKKHPEIKEASERLLFVLRTLKEKTSANPNNSFPPNVDPVAQELEKTDEGIKPFVLACDTKNQKIVPIAIGCIQRLISHKAVPNSSISIILKTLMEAMGTNMDIQLKILQTLIPLISNYDNIHDQALADALLLCIKLQDSKSPIVSNTASATLRQMVVSVFDKLVKEGIPKEENAPKSEICKDAISLFQDLCTAASGDQTILLKSATLSKVFALELIESICFNNHNIFVEQLDLHDVLKNRLCPMLTKSFSERLEFSTSVRLIRLMSVFIKKFHSLLRMECEIFFTMISKLLESTQDQPNFWLRVLLIECLKDIYSDPQLTRTLCKSFDMTNGTVNAIGDSFKCLHRVITSEKTRGFLFIPPSLDNSSKDKDAVVEEVFAFSEKICQVKMSCLDQLDKLDPPPVPDLYLIYTALLTVTQVVDGLTLDVLQLFPPKPSSPAGTQESIDLHSEKAMIALDLAQALWQPTLASIIYLFEASIDEDIFNVLLSALEKQTIVLGQLGLNGPRDAYLTALCSLCLPSIAFETTSPKFSGQPSILASSNANGVLLQERHVACIKALLNIAHNLMDSFDDKSWLSILNTLSTAESFIATGKTDKNFKDEGNKSSKIANLDNYFMNLLTSIRKLFDSTINMNLKNLDVLVHALFECAVESATVASINASTGNSSGSNAAAVNKDLSKGTTDEKIFALVKLQSVLTLNMKRLLQEDHDLSLWLFAADQTVLMAHMLNLSISMKPQIFSFFSEFMSQTFQAIEKDSIHNHETQLLLPLQRLLLLADVPDMNSDYKEKVLRSSWFSEVQKCGLETLNKILQASGQNMSTGWVAILNILTQVLNPSRSRPSLLPSESKTESPMSVNTGQQGEVDITEETPSFNTTPVASPSSNAFLATTGSSAVFGTPKSTIIVRIAFQSMQLICMDFLSLLTPETLKLSVECLGAFGIQTDDLNVSLTAIGQLWTLSDHLLVRKANQASPSDDAANTKDSKVDNVRENKIISLDQIWLQLLSTFSLLCSDLRPEVRNSANQTLFRSIQMNGHLLTLDSWRDCVFNILLPLLQRIKIESLQAEQQEKTEAPKASPSANPDMMMHHSRNSVTKQWDETKILCLSGALNVFGEFLFTLAEMQEKFISGLKLLLDYVVEWIVQGNLEVSISTLKQLKNFISLPSEKPEEFWRDDRKKLTREMWTCIWNMWLSIGYHLSDRHEVLTEEQIPIDLPLGPIDLRPRPVFIFGPYTPDILKLYIMLLEDLYPTIKDSFGIHEKRQMNAVLLHIMMYHTVSGPNTEPKYKIDTFNDLEVLSPLQTLILDYIQYGKPMRTPVQSNSSEKIDNELKPEERQDDLMDEETTALSMTSLAHLLKYPFIIKHEKISFPGGLKPLTYMALAKRVIDLIISTYISLKPSPISLYQQDSFAYIIKCFSYVMKEKGTPPQGKESVTLWKFSAEQLIVLIEHALKQFDELRKDLSLSLIQDSYQLILEILHDFLVNDRFPSTYSEEDRLVDESFDLELFQKVDAVFIPFFNRRYIAERTVQSLLTIYIDLSVVYDKNKDPKFQREQLYLSGLEKLFELCSSRGLENYKDLLEARTCIAKVAVPLVLNQSIKVFKQFIDDKASSGSVPLRRLQYRQVQAYLEYLAKWKLIPGVFSMETKYEATFSKSVLKAERAHLLYLYPVWMKLLSTLTSHMSVYIQEEQDILSLTQTCLRRIGEDLLLI